MAGFKSDQDRQDYETGLRKSGLFTEDEIKKELADIGGTPSTQPNAATTSEDPEAQYAAAKQKMYGLGGTDANTGLQPSPNVLNQIGSDISNWYQNTPLWQKGAEVGGGLAALYAGKEGIRRGAAIMFPTPGEKLLEEQNRIAQANLDLKQQQAAQAPQGPSDLELARIETEKAKAEQIRAQIASQEKRDALAAARLAAKTQPKLSPFEQQMMDLANQQAQAKAAAGSAAPPANAPKKAWEPPTASLAVSAPATPEQVTTPVETAPAAEPTGTKTSTETSKTKPVKQAKPVQPPGTGGADNWLHSMAGPELYADVIKRKNNGVPYGPGTEAQNKAYADWNEYRNEVGRMRPYTNKPVLNLQALEEQKFKSANIPGKIPLSSVPPPPSLRPSEIGQGGSLIRSLTNPLQLKQ